MWLKAVERRAQSAERLWVEGGILPRCEVVYFYDGAPRPRAPYALPRSFEVICAPLHTVHPPKHPTETSTSHQLSTSLLSAPRPCA